VQWLLHSTPTLWCSMTAVHDTCVHCRYVYECHEDFAALPTFGVIPAHPVAMFVPLEHYIPNYDRVRPRCTSTARAHNAACLYSDCWQLYYPAAASPAEMHVFLCWEQLSMRLS
jgi:hypothetical protein